MRTSTFVRVAVVAMVIVFAVSMASAQLNSTAQTIALNAKLSESLTVSLSANSVSFTLAAGSNSNPGSVGVTATTKWAMATTRSSVGVYAYFANSASALTDGAGDNIPSSAFTIADNSGAATALTSTVAFGGSNAGLQLANVVLSAASNNFSGSRTDSMVFNIDLSGGTLPSLPAATYTGTLNIQAQAL